jgi:hypothetical protein
LHGLLLLVGLLLCSGATLLRELILGQVHDFFFALLRDCWGVSALRSGLLPHL